jgi:hypothetical protein
MENDKMLAQLFMEVENTAAVRRHQHQLMLASVLRLRQPIVALAAPRRGGSRVGKKKNKEHHRQAEALLLDSDYFSDDATHTPKDFQRQLRMNKDMFMKIVFGVREYDDYFMCKQDYTGMWGLSSIQKCNVALRCLAYGAPQMQLMTTCAWRSRHAPRLSTGFAEPS